MNHNTDLLLGRQSSGTVRLWAQPDGLHYAIDVPDTTYGNDLLVVYGRGDLNEMSFGIFPGLPRDPRLPTASPWSPTQRSRALFDVSPVSLPAFAGTSMALHSVSTDGESVRSQLIRARARARSTGDVR